MDKHSQNPAILSGEETEVRSFLAAEGPLAQAGVVGIGVLRLRDCFASRNTHSAQDDRGLGVDRSRLLALLEMTMGGGCSAALQSNENFGRLTDEGVRATSILASAEACLLHGVFRNVAGGRNARHAQLEVVSIRGAFQCGFVVYETGLEQVPQRLIERLHAVLRSAGGNRIADSPRFFGDQNTFADVRSVDHDFDSRHSAITIAATNEALANHRAQARQQAASESVSAPVVERPR